MKQTQKELLAKSMTRREFLHFLLMGVLAVFGLNNFMRFMQTQGEQQKYVTVTQQHTATGFGASKFGI